MSQEAFWDEVDQATFSRDGRHRWTLTRVIGEDPRELLFIMLNPSTADALEDDPTIRRCTGFAQTWGYGKLTVVNLFALRATDPKLLKPAGEAEAIGGDNNGTIRAAARNADRVVCAWGANGSLFGRSEWLKFKVMETDGIDLYHLGLTAGGEPKHPLYLPADTKPVLWPTEWSIPEPDEPNSTSE